VEDGTNTLTRREQIGGAVFVVVMQAAQFYLLGRATILLTVGMLISYFLWFGALWKKEPGAVLPYYLIAVIVQCIHFVEEFFYGFARDFPKLFGFEWSETRFVVFNLAWLVIFAVAVVGIRRGMALAYLVLFFLAIAGGIGNGIGHVLLYVWRGRYFPGVATAPFCLIIGAALLFTVYGRRPLATKRLQ